MKSLLSSSSSLEVCSYARKFTIWFYVSCGFSLFKMLKPILWTGTYHRFWKWRAGEQTHPKNLDIDIKKYKILSTQFQLGFGATGFRATTFELLWSVDGAEVSYRCAGFCGYCGPSKPVQHSKEFSKRKYWENNKR